jgi:hypothetical protein
MIPREGLLSAPKDFNATIPNPKPQLLISPCTQLDSSAEQFCANEIWPLVLNTHLLFHHLAGSTTHQLIADREGDENSVAEGIDCCKEGQSTTITITINNSTTSTIATLASD